MHYCCKTNNFYQKQVYKIVRIFCTFIQIATSKLVQ